MKKGIVIMSNHPSNGIVDIFNLHNIERTLDIYAYLGKILCNRYQSQFPYTLNFTICVDKLPPYNFININNAIKEKLIEQINISSTEIITIPSREISLTRISQNTQNNNNYSTYSGTTKYNIIEQDTFEFYIELREYLENSNTKKTLIETDMLQLIEKYEKYLQRSDKNDIPFELYAELYL